MSTPAAPEFPESAKFRIWHDHERGMYRLDRLDHSTTAVPAWNSLGAFQTYDGAEIHMHALVSPWPMYFDEKGVEV